MIRYCCARISAPVVDPISKIYGNWNHRIFGNAVNLTQYQKVTLFNLCLMLSTILRKHLKANDLISSLGLSIYWLHRLICWLLNKCITYILYWFSSQRGFFPCAELGSVKALPHPSEQTASPWCWDTQVPHSTAVPMSSLCHATCHGPCVLHTDGWGTVEGGAGLEHLWSCQWESWGRPLHCRATLPGVWYTSPSPPQAFVHILRSWVTTRVVIVSHCPTPTTYSKAQSHSCWPRVLIQQALMKNEHWKNGEEGKERCLGRWLGLSLLQSFHWRCQQYFSPSIPSTACSDLFMWFMVHAYTNLSMHPHKTSTFI